jgi:hypothetical protein
MYEGELLEERLDLCSNNFSWVVESHYQALYQLRHVRLLCHLSILHYEL